MAISLKVLAPNQNVYEGDAEEVILPSTTGQIGVLPGHISLVTAIDICLLYTSPSPRDLSTSRMPSSA